MTLWIFPKYPWTYHPSVVPFNYEIFFMVVAVMKSC